MDNHDPSLESPPDAWIASKGEMRKAFAHPPSWFPVQNPRRVFMSRWAFQIHGFRGFWERRGERVWFSVTGSGHRSLPGGSARWTHDRIRHEIGQQLGELLADLIRADHRQEVDR